MTDLFTADFFEQNRRRLQADTNANLIILAANGVLQRSADTTFAFRQESNFWYLTGIEEPDFLLVIAEDSTFLIAPKRGDHRDQWDGALDKRAMAEISGIKEIKEHYKGWTELDVLVKKYKKIHTITPAEAYLDHFGFYANPARGALLSALAKHKRAELVDVRKNIARLRQVKQKPELAAIKRAIKITEKALLDVRKKLASYKTENEIVADITRKFIRQGAGHAYNPIVAAGKNAAVIHYINNDQPINARDLLLFDVGAEVSNYSADITRTFAPMNPTRRQKEVHKAVMNVHAQALELLGPGVDMKSYEQDVDAIMARELKSLNLLDDVTDKKRLKRYYPHLTSHFLGLDTHDAADYTRPLEPGMVLTVEPGIYIPEESIGIRVEDDVIITQNGAEVLSQSLPTGLV